MTQYLSGPKIDEIIAKKDLLGKKYYYIRDGLNSVRLVVDERGNIVQRLDYDPFGKLNKTTDLGQETTETTFAFTGREYDVETGLYFYRARYYSPDAGRFLSEDPIGIKGGINPYAYVGNNPINYIDPLGFEETCEPNDWNKLTDDFLDAVYQQIFERLQNTPGWQQYLPFEAFFDTPFYDGQNSNMLWEYNGKIYNTNEINYLGIGMYEAWKGNTIGEAYSNVGFWKSYMYDHLPSQNVLEWVDRGYQKYQELHEKYEEGKK